MRRVASAITLLVAVALAFSPVLAADYYIDPSSGNDNNAGTINQPWRTFDNIVGHYGQCYPSGAVTLQPGDTFAWRRPQSRTV